MNLEFRSIIERGNESKERLTLRAMTDCDLAAFAVLHTGSINGVVTADVNHTFWFPYAEVAKGDLIVLYTRAGTQNSRVLDSGRTAHFFFWGISRPIWEDQTSGATLLYSPEWESKLVSEF